MIETGYTYDDLLLVPKYSTVRSRAEVSLIVGLNKGFMFKSPVIGANMADISGDLFCLFMASQGCLALRHRFDSYEKQLAFLTGLTDHAKNFIGMSVGVKEEDKYNVDSFVSHGARIICIDIAHADSHAAKLRTEYISTKYPNVLLIVGNVCTVSGSQLLWGAGADVVKCGVGPGSICSTRIETGNGYPQMSALMNIAEYKPGNKYLIADGGIKQVGHITLALTQADMVMIGNMFAGTAETPGEIVYPEGPGPQQPMKSYNGSSTLKTSHVEGVKAMVPYKGPAKEVLDRIHDGLRSGLSYQGCHNLASLRIDPEFVQITAAGLAESRPHINT